MEDFGFFAIALIAGYIAIAAKDYYITQEEGR